MTEKRFLNCMLTESILLTILGICILLLPKISPVSFSFMLCFALLSYGGYRTINSWLTRNFTGHFLIIFISGIMLFLAGFALFFAPLFNLLHIIAAIGMYFIFESICTSALASRTKNLLRFRYLYYILSFLQLIFGFITIMMLPSFAFWITGILVGIDFTITGITILNMYFATIYKY